ncbi:MAG: NAD-dependent epimerase/dehydratase family protein [Rhodococcus sp. (in: high G+C Gram-positive bacteria)]
MTVRRRKVLLTGATGNWGRATLRELRDRDAVDVVAFAMPTDTDRAILDGFRDMSNLSVVWGDLTNHADVERAMDGVDLVIHVGAVVSPLADEHPKLARKVNIGSMQNIVRAARSRPDPSSVEIVGIGSVAETGHRDEPHHWGRVGDPIRVSQFDEYGQTKVVAEKLLVESGLPKWAWLRQTGIFHQGMLEIRDPIMTHTPFAGVLEWASDCDSARLLAGIAEGAPEGFWGEIYNIGGGDGWRLTNWELQVAIGEAIGVRDIRTWYDRNWFATKNFHGQWYTDSDKLEQLVPFRQDTFEEAVSRAVLASPRMMRQAGKVPPWLIKNLVMKRLSRRPRGTMSAVRRGAHDEIGAHFGSLEDWKAIGNWSTFTPPMPSRDPVYLDHGYDESVPPSAWSRSLLADAATFRGGQLLTTDPEPGNVEAPVTWRCALGHVFAGSPKLILRGGHWCPDCVQDPAGYRTQAEQNSFLAQLEGVRKVSDTSPGSRRKNIDECVMNSRAAAMYRP